MTEYVTTNIRLPKDVYREIKLRALEEEKSLAEIIRESVAAILGWSAGGGTRDRREVQWLTTGKTTRSG